MYLDNLKELCSLNGVSGDESRVRNYILDKIKPYVDSTQIDSMGNVIALKKGTNPDSKKIMVCAHMDEVGFIVSDVTDEGFVKFKEVGGFDPRILLTQKVVIDSSSGQIKGVMGIKAVHLQTADERKKVAPIDSMYIDIGASSRVDALKFVSKGDYATFDSEYRELGEGLIKAKALDDRAGCALMLELVKNKYECDIYYCFTTQEEVGLRGAGVVARRLSADIAIILESTTAADVPFVDDYLKCTVQGDGPAVSIMDRASYSDKNLNKFVCDTADMANVKYQFKKTTAGGNDAGSIQIAANAVRTCVISLPCRYIHSPVSTVRKNDINEMYALVNNLLKNIKQFEI